MLVLIYKNNLDHLLIKEKDYPIFAMRFKSPDSETNKDGETRLFLVSMKNKYSRN